MTDVLDMIGQATSSPQQAPSPAADQSSDVLNLINNAVQQPQSGTSIGSDGTPHVTVHLNQSNASSPQPASQQGQDAGAGNAFVYGTSDAVPFGNVITSGIGAGVAKLSGSDQPISQLYDQAQADTAATASANPASNLAGNVAGIAATIPLASAKVLSGSAPTQGARGVINAIPQALSSVGNFVRGGTATEGALSGVGNLALQSAKSAAVAAPIGALYGAGQANAGQRVEGAESGAGMAAGLGAAAPVAGAISKAALRTISPVVSAGMQDVAALAQKHGIPISLDQVTGSTSRKYLSNAASNIPFSGGPEFAEKQRQAFTGAVLKAAGGEGNRVTPDAVQGAYDNIGAKFDSVLKGKTIDVSPEERQAISDIPKKYRNLVSADKLDAIRSNVNEVLDNIDRNGQITGEKLGDLRSTMIERKGVADSGISHALGDIVSKLVDVSANGDPAAKAELNRARYLYKNLKTIEPLLAKSEDGNISPALLKNRVISNYGAKAVSTGKAGDLGELAKVGSIIKPVGGSNTAEKLLSYGLLSAPGAIAGAIATPGDAAKRAVGAAAGGLATVGAAKGYEGYNNSQAMVARALAKIPARELAKLPPSAISALLSKQSGATK